MKNLITTKSSYKRFKNLNRISTLHNIHSVHMKSYLTKQKKGENPAQTFKVFITAFCPFNVVITFFIDIKKRIKINEP